MKKILVLFALFQTLTAYAAPSTTEAKVQYSGGPVLTHAKVYVVYWGTDFNSYFRSDIESFYTTVLNSTYLDWLKEYNTPTQTIGRGTLAGAIAITPTNKAMELEDADIQVELEHQLEIHALPAPDANTLYMIYFPEDFSIMKNGLVSCQNFCAYHEGFASKTFGNVFYGVLPDLGGECSMGCGFEGSEFEDLTDTSSHELAEAITDPFPAIGFNPAFPQAWIAPDQNEIGDLCAESGTELKGPNGQIFVVQEEYDNATTSCSPGPFFSP
jgi:hypothetical protein